MLSNASSPGSIPAGIAVGLIASFIQSLGLTIQRKSHVLNQALPEEQQRVEHRRPLWLLGFGIFISSNLLGSVFQIAALPVVILAPLGAVSLLWNAFFARLLLGDVFSPWMFIGTLLIAGGAVLIAIFGIVPEPNHSLEDLLRLFNRPAFIVYFSLLGFAVLVCLAITHITEYSLNRRIRLPDVSPPLSPLLAPTSAPSILTTASTASHAVDPSSATERTPLIDRKPRARSNSPTPSFASSFYDLRNLSPGDARTPVILAASYASFSGIIAGMCLIFAKSGVELLLLTIGGDNQFWRWQAWVLLLALGVFALLQLWYMHKGLVLADPTLVCPLAFCFYNLSSILNGLVYFDQFSLLSTKQLLLVLLGIAILLAGVWVVSFPPTGGYGVDVGTWSEGEALVDLNLSNENEEGDADAQLITTPSAGTQGGEELFRADGEVSPKLAGDGSHRRAMTLPASRHGRASQSSDPILPSAPTPSPNSPPTRSRRRSTALTSPRRSRGSLILSPPGGDSILAPVLPAAGPGISGFSIGLSPVSPGFSLVPRERRRRSVAHGNTRGETGAEAGSAGLTASLSVGAEGRRGVAQSMRRVFSEGDVSPNGHEDVERGEEDAEHSTLLGSTARKARTKGRWSWLRGLLPAKEPRDHT